MSIIRSQYFGADLAGHPRLLEFLAALDLESYRFINTLANAASSMGVKPFPRNVLDDSISPMPYTSQGPELEVSFFTWAVDLPNQIDDPAGLATTVVSAATHASTITRDAVRVWTLSLATATRLSRLLAVKFYGGHDVLLMQSPYFYVVIDHNSLPGGDALCSLRGAFPTLLVASPGDEVPRVATETWSIAAPSLEDL